MTMNAHILLLNVNSTNIAKQNVFGVKLIGIKLFAHISKCLVFIVRKWSQDQISYITRKMNAQEYIFVQNVE